jgi:hypothetical protein
VSGNDFSFRQTTGPGAFDLTVSGDQMSGRGNFTLAVTVALN